LSGAASRPALRLGGRRVLLAYGLLGEVAASLHRFGVDYMNSLQAWLATQGADAAVVRLPTAAPVAANATRLAAALLADPRPAIIIAHSKGGLEALDALMAREAQARCTGFVALQSPFYGSPVADGIIAARPLAAAAGVLARVLRVGSDKGLRDLTTEARQAWMESHGSSIAALMRRVPTVCVATELTGPVRGRERFHLAASRWLLKQGTGPNDGLVPVRSALLPGARHLIARGSHLACVSQGPTRDPLALVARALALLEEPVQPSR